MSEKKKKAWNWRNWPSQRRIQGLPPLGCSIPQNRRNPPLKLKVKLKRYGKKPDESFEVWKRNGSGWYCLQRYYNEDEALKRLESELVLVGVING